MYILAGLILVGLTFVLSTLSFALRGYSRTRLGEFIPESSREARLVWLDRHESDAQVVVGLFRAAVNLLLLAAVFLACADSFGPQVGPAGFGLPILITLPLLMVFSIALPHVFANYAGENLLARSMNLIVWLRLIALPAVRLLDVIEFVVRKMLGRKPDTQEQVTERVEQEILDAVSEGEAQGAVDEQQKDLITSVIELGTTKVSAIMTPRSSIDGIHADASFEDVRELILETGHSRVPVYEESIDHIVGVIYAKDLLRVRSPEHFQIRKWMRLAPYVPETKSVHGLLDEFRAARIQIAIVLDEYGATAGIATIEDILEELVGEIDDEYDQKAGVIIRRIAADVVEVDGLASVWEINEELGIDLPIEGGYETIGGFLAMAMGKIPAVGEEFSHENVRFRVVDAEPRKVNRLQIQVQRAAERV